MKNNFFAYHIYPLGLCGAPFRNNYYQPIQHRINLIYDWIEHIYNLGVNVVYIGPLFESTSHGYDTYDYYHVDRRLGDRRSLALLVEAFHKRGIKVIFDAVFNHVGRDFWAFRDVLKNYNYSPYCDWFDSLEFGKRSPFGDPFSYKSWHNHYSLVKLNLRNKYVKEHLFKAVEMWIHELGVDGLRLDAADCLPITFIRDLKKFCRKTKPDFWLLGEIVHGDYRKKTGYDALDSITNYQCYKELFTCFNKKNFSILANTLKRQFGDYGEYKELNLYSFLDNHDVSRAKTHIKKVANLYPLYALLFTIPGIPSIYYGSEFGIRGKKGKSNDTELRPYLDIKSLSKKKASKDILEAIKKFSSIRVNSEALCYGYYREMYVAKHLFSFARISKNEYLIVIVNSAENHLPIELIVPDVKSGVFIDILNNNDKFYVKNNLLYVSPIWSNWARILKLVY